MRIQLLLIWTLTLLLSTYVNSSSQEEHQHHTHGAEEKVGTVDFPISCNPQAQQKFLRAVALLHSFAYEEADRAFEEVASADSKCAMAYWGIAMSNYHPLWAPPNPSELKRGMDAVAKMQSLVPETQREKDYIMAISAYYKDAERVFPSERALAYHQLIEQIYERYPDDKEAGVFYALSLNATAPAKDKTYSNQKKAVKILEKILSANPDHPGVYHYIIHNYDYPELAELALSAARTYSKVAPAVPHALHMPSHIFTRLGLWEESIQSNLDAANAGKALMARTNPGATHYDQVHAMDYLVYAYLQLNQNAKAKQVLEDLRKVEKVDVQAFSVAYSYAVSPARFAVERGDWKEAARLSLMHENFPWQKYPYAKANLHFARGLGLARTNEVASAQKDVQELMEIHKNLTVAKDPFWPNHIEVQKLCVEGWIAFAEGRKEEAVNLIQKAADLEDSIDKHPVTPGAVIPARELLADLFLEMNQPSEALKHFENSLSQSPNRLRGLFGAARAAELANDSEKARRYYSQLIQLTARGDEKREEIRRAKEFLDKAKSVSK